MKTVDNFGLRNHADGDSSERAPVSTLLFEGREVGLNLRGATLEAQFALDTGEYLLLVTNNSPYEERMQVYLLGSDFRIAETADLGYAYTSGIVRDIKLSGRDSLEFTFSGGCRFRLVVHDLPSHFWNVTGGIAEAVRVLKGRRLQLERMRSNG
jgi:hypothetical protein